MEHVRLSSLNWYTVGIPSSGWATSVLWKPNRMCQVSAVFGHHDSGCSVAKSTVFMTNNRSQCWKSVEHNMFKCCHTAFSAGGGTALWEVEVKAILLWLGVEGVCAFRCDCTERTNVSQKSSSTLNDGLNQIETAAAKKKKIRYARILRQFLF